MIYPNKMKTGFLNKAFFYVLAALSFAVTSCDKDDEEEAAPTVVEAPCKVTNLTNGGQQASVIEYNAEGYISKITESDVDDDDKPITNTTTFTYNASNQLIKTELRTTDKLLNTAVYTYKNGLIETVKQTYTQGSSESVTTYKYDGKKRIAEKSVVSDGLTYTTKYTFDDKGNVEKEEGFNEGILDSRTIYSGYDDKPTLYSAQKGLPLIEEGISKNNPGKMVATIMYDLNGDGVPEPESVYEMAYQYEYNSNGFPVKITATDSFSDKQQTVVTYECK